MAHVRRQIRVAAVARLSGLALTGPRVFPSRVHAVEEKKLPALLVYTTDERSEKHSHDPDDDDCGKRYRRVVTLAIDILAQEGDGDGADDRLDDIAVEVETAIEADESFGGLLRELVLVSSADVYSGEGERVAGRKRLTFEATYLAKAGAAETAL